MIVCPTFPICFVFVCLFLVYVGNFYVVFGQPEVLSLAFSPDGRYLCAAGTADAIEVSEFSENFQSFHKIDSCCHTIYIFGLSWNIQFTNFRFYEITKSWHTHQTVHRDELV